MAHDGHDMTMTQAPVILDDLLGLTEQAVPPVEAILEKAKTSVIDRIYNMSDMFGVLSHLDHQRKERTRVVKRALKKVRLPAGLQVPGDKPALKFQTYQVCSPCLQISK